MIEEWSGEVLVVDDDPDMREFLMQLVTDIGCRVRIATNGAACLEAVALKPPDLILLDVEMPNLDGVTCCKLLKSSSQMRHIPVVLITGLDSLDDRVRGLEAGADDYLTKPVHPTELLARVRSLLRVKHANEMLESAENVIFSLARAIEAKDLYTQGHTERVTAYALALGRGLGLSAPVLLGLRQGAILHDLGKIGVPDQILNKPGRLTVEEFDEVKKHPVIGCEICKSLKSLAQAMPCIRWHHEKPNGKGYPDGLKGNAIPQVALIMGVVDVFDALSTKRSYKEALPTDQVFLLLRAMGKEGGLDLDLVELFIKLAGHNFDEEYLRTRSLSHNRSAAAGLPA